MRRELRVSLAIAVGVATVLVPITAGRASPAPEVATTAGLPLGAWAGTSTNMTGDFSYGKVTFSVRRGAVTNFLVEGVTVSGCGGYKSIVVPRLKISGNSISGRYVPVPGIDDVITVKGRFSGGAIKGTFSEGPTCVGAGRFTARPR